jgi:hypothetical protein
MGELLLMSIQKHTMTKNELINALKKENFKEIVVFEPLDQIALSALKKMKPDDKTTILVLKS